jgi:hypothetical protein
MEHRLRNGVFAVTAVAAAGFGYWRGEVLQTSSSPDRIVAAEARLASDQTDYARLGGIGTCENIIISDISYGHTDNGSLNKTTLNKHLDSVCGVTELTKNAHRDLAATVVSNFATIYDDERGVEAAKDHNNYSGAEKLSYTVIPGLVGVLVAAYAADSIELSRRRRRHTKFLRQARQSRVTK